jgi:hypothetical protein
MNANDVPKYPYILHWSDIRDERVLTVHTSGSTGMSFDRLEIRPNKHRASKTNIIHTPYANHSRSS